MRRKIELILYGIIILFFIVRYSDVDLDRDRRSRAVPRSPIEAAPRFPSSPRRPVPIRPQEPAVLLPQGSRLPNQVATVVVTLDLQVHSGVGTAFAVDSNGTYVTARHVTDGCKNIYFVRGPQSLEKVVLLGTQKNRDFSILVAERRGNEHLRLSTRVLSRGEDGYMMGYPQGNPADVLATVLGRTEMRSTGRYKAREPVLAWVERQRKPGFGGELGGISGGPVLDENGHVVGTVVAGSPRRGRVYTTHPRVFREARLLEASRRGRIATFDAGIGARNFSEAGDRLRKNGAIKKVYCSVK
ncbi:MAG: hypothetical protein COB37_03845 [Kordiimonadales bacterium]|nr:MAG: hypothetical protein COB37_03845 [Kordiimonadales bacterium]